MSITNAQLATIYKEYVNGIFKYFYIRIGNKEISQDLTSTTFHKFIEKSDSFDEKKGNISQYLYRIARNAFIDYLRKHKDEVYPENIDENEDKCNKSEDENVVVDRNGKLLMSCIKRLKRDDQTLLHLRYTIGLSYEEIGSKLHMPVDTVGVKLHRCVEKLKKIIDKKGLKEKFDI